MPTAKGGSTVRVDRKELLTAQQRVGRVMPSNTCKPILQGVRLEASDGSLRLSATDLDVSLSATVHAEGGLVMSADEVADFFVAHRTTPSSSTVSPSTSRSSTSTSSTLAATTPARSSG